MIDTHTGGGERAGSHVDVQLRAVAAHDRHLRHARYRSQFSAYQSVGHLREHRCAECRRGKRQRHDGTLIGIETVDDRLQNLLRQLRAHGRNRVTHILHRLIDVLREHERNDDLPEAVG